LSDSTTPTTPDPVEALRAEATARLAALDAKGAPTKGAAGAEKVVDDPKETAVKASVPDGADKPVEAPKAVDVEWLPENLRSKAANLDPELAAYLKPGHMRRGEHSRAMKALEEERKQIESIKAKAGLWERLEATPEVAAKTYKMLNGESDAAPEESDEEIPDPLVDPKGYAKWLRASIVKDIAPTAAKVVEDRIVAPRNEEEAVRAACLSWAEDNHVTDNALLGEVAKKADAVAKRLGLRLTPESTPEILSLAYESMGAKASNGKVNGSANGTENGGLLKVVSPSSRGSTAVAPVGVPQHIRENRAPSTNEERVAHAAYLARERLGLKVSTEDISAMFSQRGVPAR